MIKFEKMQFFGFEPAIRGMRNPMNSWDKSDSSFCCIRDAAEYSKPYVEKDTDTVGHECVCLGTEDYNLMMKLAKAGTTHSKYRRMIVVYVDITAPLYWWKEFDTYKVGTVANSCSTMHKIAAKPFELSDFSHEHLMGEDNNDNYMLRAQVEDHFYEDGVCFPLDLLDITVKMLNQCRDAYLCTKDPEKKKQYWWQMIQLLPSSYNQKRTIMLNYEVLAGIYPNRKDHKLDEWHSFCDWIKGLPFSELITLEGGSRKVDG